MFWKRVLCSVILVLFLTGCSGSQAPMQQALDLRTSLLESGGCDFTAEISADLGERIYTFSVRCAYVSGQECRMEVLAPEEIAGITAVVTPDGAGVEFDGVALDFGTMAGGEVSAMEAAWLLAKAWNDSYISSAGIDEELYRITYLENGRQEELRIDTWLDGQGVPVYGEITCEGRRCLSVKISEFQLKP